MKKQQREEKIRFVEAAKTQKVMEAEGSITFVRDSKIGKTLETKMKNPIKEKEPTEEFEYNTDHDEDYINFLGTYDEEVDQV